MGLIAPLRMVLFYFAFISSNVALAASGHDSSSDEWTIFLQVAMGQFALGILPDLLARNWRGCMQGHAAHYLAFSALLYFSNTGGPFVPGTATIVLVNIREFFRSDLAGNATWHLVPLCGCAVWIRVT